MTDRLEQIEGFDCNRFAITQPDGQVNVLTNMERQFFGEESAGKTQVTHWYSIRVMIFCNQRLV